VTALGAGLGLAGPIRWFILGALLIIYLILFVLGICILKFKFFVSAYSRGDSTVRCVALTFDDGPDPAATRDLLELLKSHHIKAAFFPIGRKIRDCSEIIKQIDREGHILGNHTFRHVWWTNFLFSGPLDRELRLAQEAIQMTVGKVPAYFRPPMGLTNPHLKKALKKNDLSVVGWDIRTFDTTANNEKVIKRVLKKIRNGSIIALHDTGRTPADLVRLIDELVTQIKQREYTFAGLDELTGIKPYQMVIGADRTEVPPSIQSWYESKVGGKRSRFWRFIGRKLISSAYIKRALEQEVSLDAFKTSPSPRFFVGLTVILFSYILGWPMVGLFSYLSVHFQAPVLLIFGPAFYGFSYLVWIFGMYLAGRDCVKYGDTLLSWAIRRAVEWILKD
jgi:peptidoglycan/xylan/chitin deacetylase (PgdA/CDA1 family)